MPSVQDFPVSQPYGYDPSYPLNNHFHTGIDYSCPTGTPVVVNGVTIGLSGSTGASTGPHCHVGKWNGGQVLDPGVGNGFSFQNARVVTVSEDPTNGKYVRVSGDGFNWVYLHLSKQLAQVGQILKQGDDMTKPTAQQVIDAFQTHLNKDPRPEEIDYYTNHDVADLYAVLLDNRTARVRELEAGATVLKPGLYQVK